MNTEDCFEVGRTVFYKSDKIVVYRSCHDDCKMIIETADGLQVKIKDRSDKKEKAITKMIVEHLEEHYK